jgi:hypothetical protein
MALFLIFAVYCLVMSKNSRPGILVLIDETDWELSGELDSCPAAGAVIAFISTLHGG